MNSLVSGEFPAQRPVTQSFDACFDLCLNKRLSKQSWGWWFEMPSRPMWRHSNVEKYCQLHLGEQTAVLCESKCTCLQSKKCIWKWCVPNKMSANLYRFQRVTRARSITSCSLAQMLPAEAYQHMAVALMGILGQIQIPKVPYCWFGESPAMCLQNDWKFLYWRDDIFVEKQPPTSNWLITGHSLWLVSVKLHQYWFVNVSQRVIFERKSSTMHMSQTGSHLNIKILP